MMHFWRNLSRRLPAWTPDRRHPALLAAALLVVPFGVGVAPAAAGADTPDPIITVDGRGWGHGRGMGQYGSLGYALQGWSSAQILDHYYGNSYAGTIPTDTDIGVRLTAFDGGATRVGLAHGDIAITVDGAPQTSATQDWVRVTWTADGAVIAEGDDCGGPFVERAVVAGTTVELTASNDGSQGRLSLLELCEDDGDRQWVPGTVRAVFDNGVPRTVNHLPLEQYLRGVVPLESPAYWGGLGGGAGLASLEAQSVAARSYAMAEDRYSYARTCDTISCQVYRGWWRDTGGGPVQQFQTFTDTAIVNTAGVVRRLDVDGSVARTEFSSSTGGWTAGGDFPAIAGVGEDGVFGTPDDTDPDFVEDVFNVFEGFTGVEDTAGRSAFALSTGSKNVPRGHKYR